MKKEKNYFRVTIFGSARIHKTDIKYQELKEFAKALGKHGFDIVTGGGPGLMEAANAGHREGNIARIAKSIGFTIELPFESHANKHLDIKKHFHKFSSRLDNFMDNSNIVVVTTGGIGTCLELMYTWQLMQVKHICSMPVILIGEIWKDFLKWVKTNLLSNKLIDKKDLNNLYYVSDTGEAMNLILKEHKKYKKNNR